MICYSVTSCKSEVTIYPNQFFTNVKYTSIFTDVKQKLGSTKHSDITLVTQINKQK
jgi:hypothetical protein